MKNKYISSGIKGYKTIHFKWHVNTQCQYRCDYCYYINSLNKIEPQSNRESYIGVLKRLSLKSIPNFIIDLLGGEPTLHDNIDKILNTLSDNTRCNNIDIHTNMTRAASWFKQFDMRCYKKIRINGSYHPQYADSNKFIDKCITASNFKYIPYICNINVYEKYWNKIKLIVVELLDKEVNVGLQILSSVNDSWEANYTTTFRNDFNTFLEHISHKYNANIFRKQNIILIDTDNNETITDDYNIRLHDLDLFYGWSCRNVLWDIQPNGYISNGCTGESLSINNSNICNVIKCPVKTGCPCTDCYFFEKHG